MPATQQEIHEHMLKHTQDIMQGMYFLANIVSPSHDIFLLETDAQVSKCTDVQIWFQ